MPGLRQDPIKDVDIVHFPIGNADKRGDIAVQVQQRVYLHGGFVPPELCPGEQRKAEIDCGGIQRVQALVEVHADRIVSVQWPRNADQDLGKITIDAPVVSLVGVGERGARHSSTESHVIQPGAHRAQARLDIAQALAVSQLCKGHCQVLIPTGESSPVRIAAIACDTLLKLVGGHMIHELGKYGLADIHPSLSMSSRPRPHGPAGSNRQEKFKSKNPKMTLDY